MTPLKTRFERMSMKCATLFGRGWWLWIGCIAMSAIINSGTAILRLNSFFPSPQSLDFSNYYAGAWSVRTNLSPYSWSDSLLQFLQTTQDLGRVQYLNIVQSPHNSTPLWAWLMQPTTLLSFPPASILWLVLLLGVTTYCHVLLMRLAGVKDRTIILMILPLTLTFGPLFLNLTIGQNGIFLLFSALLLGAALKSRARVNQMAIPVAAWIFAVAAKIYPVLWIGCLLVLRRWRALVVATMLCLAAFGIVALLKPAISEDYWLHFLPGQTRSYHEGVSIDDQSLGAFLTRIGRDGTYEFPGLNVQEWPKVSWSWPWNFSAGAIRILSTLLMLAMGISLAYSAFRNKGKNPDGVLFSIVLFSLLLLPHMERYNHVVALAAMAWLWPHGVACRRLVVGAYGLFAISRLTHLWATLSLPVGLVASGSGLLAVILLMLGIERILVGTSEQAAHRK